MPFRFSHKQVKTRGICCEEIKIPSESFSPNRWLFSEDIKVHLRSSNFDTKSLSANFFHVADFLNKYLKKLNKSDFFMKICTPCPSGHKIQSQLNKKIMGAVIWQVHTSTMI